MDEKTILRKVKNSNGIYTCDELDITVDEWKKVLQDKSITNNYKLWLARFYQEPEHKATCKYMGDKYKCHPNVANASIKNFAEITQKILNRFEVQGTDGKPTYWVIPMKKGIEIKDLFEWTMRNELVQALEELDMTNPEDFEENINFWSGGIYWGKEKKFEEFSTNNYWQIGWDKDSDNKSAKEAWKNIKRIQIGDLLSFHGYGGTNDLKIYQISKVVDKDEENGKLFIEKLNKKEDVLFHDKAPKMDKGVWFGTLFQVTGEEAINKIFGNYIQGDTQMTQEDTLVKKYADLLKNTKNLILTGAPGTGKTYLAKQIAKELGCEDDNIGFVQFHPSYDYTDFVEGLRPVQDENGNGSQIGFERKDGVFKAFCARALKINDEEINEFFFDRQFSVKGDLTGFNVIIKDENIEITNPYHNIESSKSEFRDYLNNTESVDKNRKKIQILVYDYIRNEILKNKKQNFVFIIDEINRGEVAKIFGELFYCVDPGYRGEKGRISTQYQNLVTCGEFQEGFFIPENVYIIGTMNDIDRSVESMDFAFRRRFTWAEVKASDTVDMLYPSTTENGEPTGLESKELADEAKRRMENLNNAISEIEGLNEAYHIGASYFLKLKNYDGNQDERFESLWEYHIKGILQEYLRGNPNGKLEDLKATYDKREE